MAGENETVMLWTIKDVTEWLKINEFDEEVQRKFTGYMLLDF